MNTFFKQISCFSFLVLFSTCSQIQARDSRFFAKYVHISQNTNNIQHSAPTPAISQISSAPSPLIAETGAVPVPVPAPASIESDSVYYGLYGKGGLTDEFPFEITAAKTEGVDDEFSTEEFKMDNFKESNARESNIYNNNNIYSNSYDNNNNNNNGYSKTNLNGYTVKPEGMSDTRSLENGKYYSDIKSEYNGYYPVRENGNEEGYYNRKSKYEFDSIDEYEKREGYPDVQRDQYIP